MRLITPLRAVEVTDLSLDHDLGLRKARTGYKVLLWIEELVATTDFVPPNISIHTANTSARERMNLAVASIKRRLQQRS